MTSSRKCARRLTTWTRYRDRCDRLVAGQRKTVRILHPMRITPGFFRAEGWNTDDVRSDLRHGA